MKKTMLFFVVISFFLLGCSSELPPEPGAPGDQAAPVEKQLNTVMRMALHSILFQENNFSSWILWL